MSEELSIIGLEGSSPERRQAIILLSRNDAYMSEELSIIGLDKGSSPERRQAIILTNAGILLLLIGTLVKFILFYSRKCIWKCCLWDGDNFLRM